MQGQDPSVILDFNVDPGLVHDNLWRENALDFKGTGNFWQDILDYPEIYSYPAGMIPEDI